MEMYQHDRAASFQFVLRGELTGDAVPELECAWTTARSIIAGKELVVDISGMTNADHSGIDLLTRMRESGARLCCAAAGIGGDPPLSGSAGGSARRLAPCSCMARPV